MLEHLIRDRYEPLHDTFYGETLRRMGIWVSPACLIGALFRDSRKEADMIPVATAAMRTSAFGVSN